MEQTLKETKSIRVKWYYKIFAKLDNEKTTVDTTNRVFAYIIDWVLGTFVTAFPTVFMYMSLTKSTEVNQNLLTFPSYYGFIAGGLSLLLCICSAKSSQGTDVWEKVHGYQNREVRR